MIITRLKQILRLVYYKYFGALVAESGKRGLRDKVLTLPITREYPFDVEAKLLMTIDIKLFPMLDIGANTGFYSAILEDIVGSDNLYIFEPLPELHRYLRKRFKNAHVFDFALSEREGTQNIRVPYIDGERFNTRATLNKHIEPSQTGFEETEVRLFPLDYMVKKLCLDSIGFIKIDVEGYELEVVNGGAETMTRFKPLVLIEIESRHHQYPIVNIFSKFEDIGYKGYYINPENFELLKVSQFNAGRDQNKKCLRSRKFFRYLNNFFFVHESSENDFVFKTIIFLELEKKLAEQNAAADADKL